MHKAAATFDLKGRAIRDLKIFPQCHRHNNAILLQRKWPVGAKITSDNKKCRYLIFILPTTKCISNDNLVFKTMSDFITMRHSSRNTLTYAVFIWTHYVGKPDKNREKKPMTGKKYSFGWFKCIIIRGAIYSVAQCIIAHTQ